MLAHQHTINTPIFSNNINSYITELNKQNDSTINNFRVVVRVRPPLNRELEHGKFISTVRKK